MDARNQTELNARIKKVKRQKNIFLTLAIILNTVLILVILWNFFSPSLYVDLNSWGPFTLLVLVINYIYHYLLSLWHSLKEKNRF